MTYLQSIPVPILVLLGVAIFYPILSRILLEVAHPLRLRVVELGRSLVHDGNLTPTQKEHVWSVLRLNSSAIPMWCFALAAPFAVIVSAFRRRPREHEREISELLKDERFSEMLDLDIAAHALGNPIAAIIVALELALLSLTGIFFFLGIGGLRRALVRTIELTTRERHQNHSGAARA